MPRPSRPVQALVLAAALGFVALPTGAHAWRTLASTADLHFLVGPRALIAALPGLVLVAAVGRVALAWLPPGEPGAHRLSELGATWAASHLVGLVVCGVASSFAWLRPWLPAMLIAVGTGLALLLRLATLPGAMEPRERLPEEPPAGGARALAVLFAAALVLPLALVHWTGGNASLDGLASALVGVRSGAFGDERMPVLALDWLRAGARWTGTELPLETLAVLAPFTWAAALSLVAFALRQARRAPLGRFGALAALALVPAGVLRAASFSPALWPALAFGAGACFLVPWLRRANRRAALLAALAFAACAQTAGATGLGLAGLAALVLATAAPARRFALGCAAGAALVVAAPALLARAVQPETSLLVARASGGTLEELRARLRAALDLDLWGISWPLFALAAILATLAVEGRKARARRRLPGVADEPARELAGLALALALGLVATLLRSPGRYPPGAVPVRAALLEAQDGLFALLPAAAVFAALVFVRPERYGHEASATHDPRNAT